MITPQVYLEIERAQNSIIAQARACILDALKEARDCPVPEHLRPATPGDIVEGQILWYPMYDYWKIVSEVLRPADRWKAYCAHCGGRYGLDYAFVEVDDND